MQFCLHNSGLRDAAETLGLFGLASLNHDETVIEITVPGVDGLVVIRKVPFLLTNLPCGKSRFYTVKKSPRKSLGA